MKDKISKIKIPSTHVLLSLDVCSLFTNIPCDLVLDSLDRRYTHIHNKCKIPFHEIRNTVRFLFDNTFFNFNNKTYKQIFGTPMGSPISPLFADMVMEDLETDCLRELKATHDCIPLFYFRYVDDTIVCIKSEQVDTVLQVFNNYNTHLKFTFESEIENSINFLDLTLMRKNNQILTNWYQKTTSSSRLLNYNSNHTTKQKINIVANLVDRAILLSDTCFHDTNIHKITELLLCNDYPSEFINIHIQNRLRKLKFNNRKTNENRPLTTISIPYSNTFYKKCSYILNKYNIRTVPLINKKLNNIIKLGKDKIEKSETCGVVYKINCMSCSATYIGETKRMSKIRVKEHERDKENKSVIATHQRTENHTVDWKNIQILDREKDYTKRIISEMLHINLNHNTINRIEDTQNLNVIYKKLLRTMRLKM